MDDDIPGATFCDDFSDGVSDDVLGGYSEHRDVLPSPNVRSDHWVQSLGRNCRDRSATFSDDVAQSQKDNVESQQCIGVEVAQENFNGQVPQNGLALNACDERPLQGSKLMKRPPLRTAMQTRVSGFTPLRKFWVSQKKS